MQVIVSTHQGQLLSDEFDYIVCKNENGEFAIMKGHIPTVSVIGKGLVRLVFKGNTIFLAVENGILEFKEEVVRIVAQGAVLGRTRESVIENLEKATNARLESNRKQSVDFTGKEKELIKEIKKANAGNL